MLRSGDRLYEPDPTLRRIKQLRVDGPLLQACVVDGVLEPVRVRVPAGEQLVGDVLPARERCRPA